MPDWLSFRKKSSSDEPPPVLELLVVEGEDAGQQFTVDAASVAIARGTPRSGQPGAILLRDPTVSSHQALIKIGDDGPLLEHQRGATNPTLVNGQVITVEPIRAGDRIQMGRVVLEVRERSGIALGGLNDSSGERRAARESEATEPAGDTTEVRPVALPSLHLVVVRGAPGLEGHRFPLEPGNAVIGRDPRSEVHIDVRAVSRRHAEIVWEGELPSIAHHSQTNQTFVNGVAVEGTRPLALGDEVRLADRVVLRLEADSLPEATPTPPPEQPPVARREPDTQHTSLQVRMEEKIRRDKEIEDKYAVTGSFLDIDVVGSYKMKSQSNRPEHIIVSFERWRSWVQGIVEEFGGLVLNSNGDELMCFFDSTHQSVRAASAILGRLADFNASQNMLPSDFQLRVGIHTGSSLVDRKRGVAYSEVLDVAGHLQKDAEVNGLLVSEDTLQALPEELPFEAAGHLERENIRTYRLTGPVD